MIFPAFILERFTFETPTMSVCCLTIGYKSLNVIIVLWADLLGGIIVIEDYLAYKAEEKNGNSSNRINICRH